MAWHSDAEKNLKKNGAIASMSFGADQICIQKQRKKRFPEYSKRKPAGHEG
jgi:alkylated DNA repair dioxygenase AlkB